MSFEQLQLQHQLLQHDIFCFVQIRNYISKSTILIEHQNASNVEKILFGSVGKIYLCVLSFNKRIFLC